ncbi:hypothetical protein Cs7R123_11520 [Catellatospora sp. TT07R-123]|uniref:glutaminase A n=1 Tax=Catellatospora sp. TT07R-123 TaxID=2733863 RepID=UPI001AFE5252|nr:glutaminase A [Catellatospora sp. TT07R-123]GHJ43810.1 hypothetical protein Cs7R123_11520 [Catellatospora sp. TT07R-123]
MEAALAPARAVTLALAELHQRLSAVREGAVADYIPQLAHADPAAFGLALTGVDGHRYAAGDTATRFTLQSVSKPFVYALVLAELGLDAVTERVGAEPSGEAFNAISLEPVTGRPANPMVNAGAIATTALVPGDGPEQRFERILAGLSAFAGRRLDVDEAVYDSELATGDRNRALAYLMHGAGVLTVPVAEATGTYFRQCAVRVDAADLAVMAATLAGGGINPVTREPVVPALAAERTLAVMASCGMYDAAGDWLLRVGLPAKSGVSGALIACSPSRFGIGVFSPPLDAVGNPVRGVLALRELSERYALHLMHHREPGAATVSLARCDGRVATVAARGTLEFTETERLLSALAETVAPLRDTGGGLVLDLAEVTAVDQVSAGMLREDLAYLGAHGLTVASVGPSSPVRPVFGTRAEAVDWCLRTARR